MQGKGMEECGEGEAKRAGKWERKGEGTEEGQRKVQREGGMERERGGDNLLHEAEEG